MYASVFISTFLRERGCLTGEKDEIKTDYGAGRHDKRGVFHKVDVD